MSLKIISHCRITAGHVEKDGTTVFEASATDHTAFLADFYRHLGIDYRKFFKMDNLSKLGFLASELLLADLDRTAANTDTAVILFSRCSSLDIDTRYQQSISPNEYFPSPSEFVYTLPNIVTGEIAIRNRIFGETACYISEHPNCEDVFRQAEDALGDETMRRCLCGWVDFYKERCEAEMWWLERE